MGISQYIWDIMCDQAKNHKVFLG